MQSINCPSCSNEMAYVPEFAGKKIACPSCNAVFTQAPADDELPRISIEPSVNPTEATEKVAATPPAIRRALAKKLILFATLLWPFASVWAGYSTSTSIWENKVVSETGHGTVIWGTWRDAAGAQIMSREAAWGIAFQGGLYSAIFVTMIYLCLLLFLVVIWFAVG